MLLFKKFPLTLKTLRPKKLDSGVEGEGIPGWWIRRRISNKNKGKWGKMGQAPEILGILVPARNPGDCQEHGPIYAT